MAEREKKRGREIGIAGPCESESLNITNNWQKKLRKKERRKGCLKSKKNGERGRLSRQKRRKNYRT